MILIADNFQITNPDIAHAVNHLLADPIQDLIRKYEMAGADAIDINTGPLSRDAEKTMSFLVETVQEVTDLPILLDTANPDAIRAGLTVNKKKIIINGFSLEPHKLDTILPLAKEFDADIIGYLLYANSQVPANASERLAIAVELYHQFRSLDIDPQRLIIDPVVVPLMWNNGSFQAKEILSVLRNLPDLLDFPVKTIVGLSNLTTGKGEREKKLQMEQAYLAMAASAGLDMVLLNIFHEQTKRTAGTCSLITNPGIFTWEEINPYVA